MPRATDISKYHMLGKVANFCCCQSDLFFGWSDIFFWLNVVKRSSNKILNSWKKEKLSTSMKLNQQHCILILKLISKFYLLFPYSVTSSNLPPLTIVYFALINRPFQLQNVIQIACLWSKLWWPLPAFLPLNLNVFIIEYIVQNHFVPVSKTLSWAPNCSTVCCSSILKMVGHYYLQNIWYFEFAENYHFRFYFLAALVHKKLHAQIFCK